MNTKPAQCAGSENFAGGQVPSDRTKKPSRKWAKFHAARELIAAERERARGGEANGCESHE